MSNDMVAPEDLTHLAGAPFTEAEVDAAVQAVRLAAGWHIVPVREETLTLDVTCTDRWLRLPTRKLLEVSAIRDADTGTVIDPARYRVSRNLAQVIRSGYWPSGYERVEVDVSHGFETAPLELLSVVGEAALLARRDQSVRQATAGSFSATFGWSSGGGSPIGSLSILDHYTVRQFGFA